MPATQAKTTTVELTEVEIRLLVEALETRVDHLRDWGHHEGHWRTPAERELVLQPLDALAGRLMTV